MAKYFIPDTVKGGFKHLIQLDKDKLTLIVNKIKEFKIGSSPVEFVESLSPLEIENIDEIANTVFSFSGLLIQNEETHKILAEGLINTYFLESEENPETNEKDKIIENLEYIFDNAEPLITTYKIFEVSDDFLNSYRDSSISTDIRVIFNSDLESKERYAVITQQLKIEYKSAAKRSEIFMNMERSDLEELKLAIEKALDKDDLLQRDYGDIFKFIQP